jgi:hypothetical protein
MFGQERPNDVLLFAAFQTGGFGEHRQPIIVFLQLKELTRHTFLGGDHLWNIIILDI